MDFHSLSRKELQTLCKKNKIPANITNVAMADALAALPQVEGLDKFLNPTEADAETGTPDIHHHRTACRTSTRRKGIREVPESTNVSTRLHRGTRAKNVEVEQENKDSNVNVPITPAVVPSSRRRAPAVSTRRKKEVEVDDKNGVQGKPTDVLKTPAAAPSSRTRATETPGGGTSAQPAYNTRRSVRFLEKNLSMMSLLDAEDMGPAKTDNGISEEMSNVSQQTEDSAETEKVNDAGASLQTLSTVVSDKTDELEVSSLEKNTEYECQLHDLDSGSEVELASGTENDVGAGVTVEPQEKAEPHDSNLKLEGNSETYDDSNEVIECCDESVVDLNKSIATGEGVHADNETGSQLLSELEDSCDSSEPDNKKCLGTKQDALPVEASEDAFMKVTDGASMEVTDQDVDGFHPMPSVSDDSVNPKELVECNTDNQGINEDDDNQDNNETADGNYIQNFEPMYDGEEKAADEKDLASPEGVLELGSSTFCSSGELQEEEHSEESRAEMDNASDVTGASSAILAVEKDASSENTVAVIEVCTESSADESMDAENVTLEASLLDVGVHETEDQKEDSEKLEAKAQAEESEEHAAGEETALDAASAFPCVPDGICSPQIPIFHQQVSVESAGSSIDSCSSDALVSVLSHNSNTPVDGTGASSAILAVEKDASSENSVAVVEVCTESSADESMDAENVTLEASLLDVGVHETEDQKEDSEKLEAKAQAEESEDQAAGEETALDAASAFPCVPDEICCPQIPIFHQQVSVESAGSSLDSCSSDALVSVLSYNSNTLVDGGDVVPEEIAIPKQESSVSAETMTVAPIHERKTSDIPIQSIVADHLKGESLCPAQSETKGVANEIQTVPKMISSTEDNMHNVNMMKQNTTDELHNMSIRELRKQVKKLTLDGKSNCMRKTNNVVKEEVEKKRIALQALPENRMTTGEAQNDG